MLDLYSGYFSLEEYRSLKCLAVLENNTYIKLINNIVELLFCIYTYISTLYPQTEISWCLKKDNIHENISNNFVLILSCQQS